MKKYRERRCDTSRLTGVNEAAQPSSHAHLLMLHAEALRVFEYRTHLVGRLPSEFCARITSSSLASAEFGDPDCRSKCYTSWGVEAEEVHREGECHERGVKLSKKRTLWDSIVEKDFRGPAPDSVFGGLESSLLLLLPWSSLLPPLNALED